MSTTEVVNNNDDMVPTTTDLNNFKGGSTSSESFQAPENIDDILKENSKGIFTCSNIPGAKFNNAQLPFIGGAEIQNDDDLPPYATDNLYKEEEYVEFAKRIDEHINSKYENNDVMVIKRRQEIWIKFFHYYGGKKSALSRFLCAREGQVDKAMEMIISCVEFREENDVANILVENDSRNDIVKYIRQHWTATVFGLTYDGSPVQYHHLRNIDVGQLCAPGENNLRIFYLWWMENCLQVQRAGHKAKRDCKGPMCQSIEIYDFKNVSLWTMTYNIFGLRIFSRALDVGQDNYPENLRKAFIINAPTIVTILWSIVLKTLSERTKSKISLTSHDNREGLREFVDDATIDKMFSM